jgi:hypothetical protein
MRRYRALRLGGVEQIGLYEYALGGGDEALYAAERGDRAGDGAVYLFAFISAADRDGDL